MMMKDITVGAILKKKLKKKKKNQTTVCLSTNIMSNCNKIHIHHTTVVHFQIQATGRAGAGATGAAGGAATDDRTATGSGICAGGAGGGANIRCTTQRILSSHVTRDVGGFQWYTRWSWFRRLWR